MRKKFTYLISLAVAMICSSGGVAWGQTYWSTGTASAEVWTCYPPTSNATCGEGVLIDGHNYYAYIGSIQGWGGTLTPTPSHSGYTTSSADPETYAAVSYSTSYNSTTGTITITRKTITHHYASHSCGVSCTEYSHTYSFSLDYKYIDVSSSGVSGHYVYPDVSHLNPKNSTTHAYDLNWTAHPGAHVATHAPINVTLTKVQSTLSFKDPHYHHYHYNWTWDSGWSSKIEESPAENAYVVNNKMTISDSEGLRLTGSGGTSEIDQVKDNDGNNSSNNEASYLNFGTSNHKLYFDEDWKGGTANGSAGAWLLNDVTWNWLPSKDGVKKDEAVGFNKKYTGTAFNLTGGVLALGSQCAHGNINVTSSDAITTSTGVGVLVNAYEAEAPNCGTPTGHDVGYTSGSGNLVTTIAGSSLKITNTFGNCYAVNFCDNFAPTFSGSGELLINPNVTNFKAGANLSGNTGNINIYSKNITNTGDFLYTSGGGNLHVNITIPYSPIGTGCDGCGFFNVTGKLTTDDAAGGTIKIDDSDMSADDVAGGYVLIGGDYAHTGGSTSSTIDVNGKIDVVGKTDFTASSKDKVDFKSNGSFINFGSATAKTFQYTGEGPGYLNIWANGACSTGTCYPGGYVNFAGKVTTTSKGTNTVKIESTTSYVQMEDGFFHDAASATPIAIGDMYVKAPNSQVRILSTNNLVINRKGDATDSISGKSVYVEGTTTYTQTAANPTTTTQGLHIKGWGAPCTDYCNWPDNFVNKGGYVYLTKAVETTNTLEGITNIISNLDSVGMGDGYTHVGADGNMLVYGDTAVHIWGGTSPEGLKITRTNTASNKGSDAIVSPRGDIYIQKGVNYAQNTPLLTGYEFRIWASGTCGTLYCDGTGFVAANRLKGGPVVVDDLVKVVHKGDGTTLIQSARDSVGLHKGYKYTGVNGNMTVNGHSGVEFTGASAADVVTINRAPTQSGTNPAVWDSIVSPAGQIHMSEPFTYTLTSKAVTGGLLINASETGYNCTPVCGSYGGYVWLESPVNINANIAGITPANTEGVAIIRSGYVPNETVSTSPIDDQALAAKGGHFVRMDDVATGYNYIGFNGNMLIEALGTCGTTCGILKSSAGSMVNMGNSNVSNGSAVGYEEGYLKEDAANNPTLQEAYNGRPNGYKGGGYIWIQGPVSVDYNTNTAALDGNATFHSAWDIIQFDQTFDFKDKMGSNLLVDGDKGIRTIGVTTITQNDYNHATNQGTTHYLSENGFVDFFDQFNYTAKSATATDADRKSALDIDGSHRVEFWKPAIIDMSAVAASTGTVGHADIYSNHGWVDFQDRLKFTGNDGDFIVWAEGSGSRVGVRSCIDSTHVCDIEERGGFVHFSLIDSIIYTPQTLANGNTWIRSYNDDVKIDSTFYYSNKTKGDGNGLFVMQAGQDIYGISDDAAGSQNNLYDNEDKPSAHEHQITIEQYGERNILFQAKKTIHLVQDLYFDRTDATKGDIILSAGYNYFTDTTNVDAMNQYSSVPEDDPALNTDWDKSAGQTPNDYISRYSCQSDEGGDIWFEGHAYFTKFNETVDNDVDVALRAWKTIYIDQKMEYLRKSDVSGNAFLFAHTGNVEAIEGSQKVPEYPANSEDKTQVLFTIDNNKNKSEVRIQAGNQADSTINDAKGVRNNGICMKNESFLNNWIDDGKGEYEGNILFNKALKVTTNGDNHTELSASRDIENQVNGPFMFTYDKIDAKDSVVMTAGRHIENHSGITFTFDNSLAHVYQPNLGGIDTNQIVMRAGRLGDPLFDCKPTWCKANEEGSSLTQAGQVRSTAAEKAKVPYDPTLVTQTSSSVPTIDNEFSKGGKGQGSILMFDSVVFNYYGNGGILMTALNGNIESDPYLHRSQTTAIVGNPANTGKGYDVINNVHDAQLTFNHGGGGTTRMEAIDIKLHDKVAYIANQTANNRNGEFYMAAFDSILTRNIEYRNHTDQGSVYITTDKIKDPQECGDYDCDMAYHPGVGGGPGGIVQGHIVLGYGADKTRTDDIVNKSDSIVFEFSAAPTANGNTIGANLYIKAGYLGFNKNKVNGKANPTLFKEASGDNNPYKEKYVAADQGKGYGGNITFDFMKVDMAKGDGRIGGYAEISTPNGNIWGKDSIQYHGMYGDLLVDAGLGSLEDTARAIRWNAYGVTCAGGKEKTLNTQVPTTCDEPGLWRTGNIIMKGGSLHFNDVIANTYTTPSASGQTVGTGDAIFRTREGFIDTYDAFSVDSMSGDLLKYAGTLNATTEKTNEWGDISERDFFYTPVEKSGSIFYGADDNIMMNYGYSNYDAGTKADGFAYGGLGQYDLTLKSGTALSEDINPFYSTTYMPTGADAEISGIKYRSVYNVNEDGYMWYRNHPEDGNGGTHGSVVWKNGLHKLYRTCHDTPSGDASCSPTTGECKTVDNHARDLYFNFDVNSFGDDIQSGGLGVVAMNYIDMFTKFTYYGGEGSGMGTVPGMNTLHGEPVATKGLYIKSLSLANGTINSNVVEHRRLTCEGCGVLTSRYMGAWDEAEATRNHNDLETYEWTYVGFHDDARIYTQDQKGLIEAPVVEFFGHAELNPYMAPTNSSSPYGAGELKVKGDSLIFHDSAIFDGSKLELLPYTTDANRRSNDMRYGVINDKGGVRNNVQFYRVYGKAIEMVDRMQPVIEFGYQRCYEPTKAAWEAPNRRSMEDKETTPTVGGDIIVSCRDGYQFPIFNTVVANHARISFISDSIDGDGTITRNVVDAIVRTDLLRIRNNVEFYTGNFDNGDPNNSPSFRRGTLKMTPLASISSAFEAGIFPNHLHLEPGSELSLVGEDSLSVEGMTTVGGYGNLHENVTVKGNGTIAPGLASLMEGDCQTSYNQGKLTIHNLVMRQNAIFRISIGDDNLCYNEELMANEWCTKTDTLVVEDTIQMWEKIYLRVLPKTEHIDEGCYLFLVYGDSTGSSKERVKNLVLDPNSLKYDDKYLGLDFSEPGKVYLCVSAFPMPEIQRYVTLPSVTGVTTTPNVGTHYVKGNQNFSFTASYAGAPLKVTAEGYYSHEVRDLDYTAVVQPDGSYLYTIYQVVEPWNVQIGPEASTVGNEAIDGQRVWAYKNTLHINVDKSDIVSIYNLTGVLYKKIEVPEGNSKFTLDRGMYVVTLKDGSVYKIVIK